MSLVTPPLPEAAVADAARRLRGHVRRTPVLELEPAVAGTPSAVTLMLECLQVTGTFKARNAFSLLLGGEIPAAGVVAASGGLLAHPYDLPEIVAGAGTCGLELAPAATR